jgi:large subunit ribosomal protein L21
MYSMFAIIETGGKQYKVAPQDKVTIELLDLEPGADVVFEKVLLVSEGEDVRVGSPAVDGAKVTAKVVEQKRGEKLIAFRKRRRKDSKKKIGHRQHLTVVEITAIQA